MPCVYIRHSTEHVYRIKYDRELECKISDLDPVLPTSISQIPILRIYFYRNNITTLRNDYKTSWTTVPLFFFLGYISDSDNALFYYMEPH